MRASRKVELLQKQRMVERRSRAALAAAAERGGAASTEVAAATGGRSTWLWVGAGLLGVGLAAAAIGSAMAGSASTKDKKASRREQRRAVKSPTRSPPRKKNAPKPAVDGGAMKGYKTTADGRTTSFFHNDLDETAKSLLKGDYKSHIAPQAVSSAVATTVNKTGVGSEWNDGSTWEDRDISVEVRARLAALLHPLSVESDGMRARTTAVKAVEGDANVMVARGKTKRIFNLACTVCWEASAVAAAGDGAAGDAAAAAVVRGEITLCDINDDPEDVEIAWAQTAGGPRAVVKQAEQLTKKADSALQAALLERLGVLRAEILAR